MIARAVVCLIACLVFHSPAPAQTSLLWQLPPGRVLEVVRIATQKQTVETRGKQFKQEHESTWHIRLAVRGGEPLLISAVLTKVEQKSNGVAPHEMIDPKLAEKMQGSSFTLAVMPDGRLVGMQGYEKFLDRLADNDPKRLKGLRVVFAEDDLKQTFADIFGPLPGTKVARGDNWQRTFVEPIPHFGALNAAARYVYDGKANGHDRIAYTLQTTYWLPPEEKMSLFRIVKGTIQTEKSTGTITFDNAAGHLVEHLRSTSLRGTLTIESMNQKHPLEFSSDNDVKIRVKSQAPR